MQVIRSIHDMQQVALRLRRDGERVGLVPTMGYLHEGHLSLVRRARAEADVVIVSLFVNPTQFGPNEDLAQYPRDQERDEAVCSDEGVDILFCPSAEEMYAPDHGLYVDEDCVTRFFEGASRPEHFRGVLTVVAKLFNIVQPEVAVFGQKDVQQLCAIKRMVRELNIPVRIVEGPTVREPDGLAMSSRNRHLSKKERQQAVCLRAALDRGRALFAEGERNAERIVKAMSEVITKAPLAELDYAAVAKADTFEPAVNAESGDIVALAVRFGSARLIDNDRLC